MAWRFIWRIAAFVLLALVLVVVAVGVARFHPRASGVGARPSARRASPEQLRRDVALLPPFRAASNPAVLAHAEDAVAARLGELGWGVTRQDVEHGVSDWQPFPTPRTGAHNLVARRGLAVGPLVLVAAHLDSVLRSPGGDDDGSGVAVLLELARVLAPEDAAHVELVFFNEEEDGLYGSLTFVAGLTREERARIQGAIVLDMVGAFESAPHSQRYPPPLSWLAPDRGDFLALIALTDADALVQRFEHARAIAAPDLRTVTFEPSRLLADHFDDIWRSDHAPFWEAGVPALFLSDTGEFRRASYHTPNDMAAALDFERMAALTDALAELVRAPTR